MKNIKRKSHGDPFMIFSRAIRQLFIHIETLPVSFFKTKKNIKKRVRFNLVNNNRLKRHLFKMLLKSCKSRYEKSLEDKISNEIIDSLNFKSLSLKNKREFLLELRKLRPSAIIVKRKKRRKKINRL